MAQLTVYDFSLTKNVAPAENYKNYNNKKNIVSSYSLKRYGYLSFDALGTLDKKK